MAETNGSRARKKRTSDRRRWFALLLVCAAQLMLVLDGTIVNVALPVIGDSLGFSEVGLSWVVNAYLLTFGGFLLLGGRAGDLFGRRRVFMAGLVLFTVASLLCGLAGSQVLLIAARALQGMGGALMAPAALSIVITTFREPGGAGASDGHLGLRLVGIPNLHAHIEDVAADGDKVYARLTVTGTNAGRFFGAPPPGAPTRRTCSTTRGSRTAESSSGSSRVTPSRNSDKCTRGPPREPSSRAQAFSAPQPSSHSGAVGTALR